MGQLKNGTGEIFDQAKQAYYTFKDGKLVGVRQLDPGRVTPDDELLFNAVTLAVGAPELAVGVKATGEAAYQGVKSLLGTEAVAALRSSSKDLLANTVSAAKARAEAALHRLSEHVSWPFGRTSVDNLPVPPVTAGHPPPPAAAEHAHPLPVSGGHPIAGVAEADPSGYAPHAPAVATELNNAFVGGHPTTSLAQQVADLSTHHVPSPVGDLGKADRVVLGKWDGMDGGYIGEARHNGGIYFDTGDATWDAIGHGLNDRQSRALGWQVNEQFLRSQMENGVARIEYVVDYKRFSSLDDVVRADPKSFSAKEIRFLDDNAAVYGYHRVGNSWVRMGGGTP